MTLLDPRPELIVIERRLAGHKRLDAILAATTRLPKQECAPIGWPAVDYLQRHREWLLLCEYSDWLDRCKEQVP
jgi:hypothetical protein